MKTKRLKERTPFAVFPQHGNEPWIDVKDCGISFLTLMIDGLAMVVEQGKGGRTYIRVRDCLEWHKKEWADYKHKGSDIAITALEKVLERFSTGDVEMRNE